jgi:hypothetical protein
MDKEVPDLSDREQREHHSEENEARYVGVLCDQHRFVEMQAVEVEHGRGLFTEWKKGFRCVVPGCGRFFGPEGYADLNKDTKFENGLAPIFDTTS